MTKSELRTGMVVYTRDSDCGIVFLNVCSDGLTDGRDIIVFKSGTWIDFSDYNDDLKCIYCNRIDIMKIKVLNTALDLRDGFSEIKCRKTIWERQEAKKMTVAEVESILGYKVEIISEKEN